MKVVAGRNHTEGEHNHSSCSHIEACLASEEVRHCAEDKGTKDKTNNSQGVEIWCVVSLGQTIMGSLLTRQPHLLTHPIVLCNSSVPELSGVIGPGRASSQVSLSLGQTK